MRIEDINELTISGHVEQQPRLREEPDGICVCDFTLTHAIYDQAQGWVVQFYNVAIWGELAQQYADYWEPGQVIVITGHLDYELRDTPAGPIPRITDPPRPRHAHRTAPHQHRRTDRLRAARHARRTDPAPPHHHGVATTGRRSIMATNALQQQLSGLSAQHSLLIATTDRDQRAFLAAQLDADGHTVHEADSMAGAVAKLSAHAIDVMILGRLERPADAPALLRAVRGGEHPRIHPGQPVITLGSDDELTVLRAYESGSDHHLPDSTSYLLLRAVLTSIARRALQDVSSRHVQVGDIHIDLAARSVDVAGRTIHLSRLEFELLAKFASDPIRVFSKHELGRCIWHHEQINSRTVDGHVCRLRTRLADAGATTVLVNKWGQGWSLTTAQ